MLETQNIPVTQDRVNQNQWTGITMDIDKTIGGLLREARESKGHSLKKISQHTKINLTLLEALEEDRLEKLPNKAYVVGFVKAYAQLVDLNPLDCIETLNRTYGHHASQKPKKQRSGLLKSGGSPENSPILAMGLAFVVLVLIGATVVFLNSNREKIVQKPVVITQNLTESTPLKVEGTQGLPSQTAQNTAEPLKKSIPDESTMVAGMSITPLEVVIHEQLMGLDLQDPKAAMSVKVASLIPESSATAAPALEVKTVTIQAEKAKPETTKAEEKDEDKKFTFRPISDTIYTVVEEGSKQALESYVPKNIQASIVKNKQNVYITAVDGDTWLTYKIDQDPIKRFTLAKDKSIIIRGDEIRIFLGNANVTRIFLNNKLLDVLSKNGVKSLVIPKENASKYQVPLFVFDQGQPYTSDEFLKKQEQEKAP